MKTHKFDSLSFLAGLVITAIGLAFLLLPDLDGIISLFVDAGSWFWPALLMAVGIAVLAPLAARRRGATRVAGAETDEGSED